MIDHRQLQPNVMTTDADAATVLIQFGNTMRHDRYDQIRGFANRAGEQAMRVAVTMAAFRMHETVELEDAELAVALMEWFVEHRMALDIGLNVVNPEIARGAEELKRYMDRLNLDRITSARLKQVGPKVLRDMNAKQFEQVIAEGRINGWFDAAASRSKNGRAIFEISKFTDEDLGTQAGVPQQIAEDATVGTI
jgi:DNA replicative helicase MCM subunit Mcm2 (Cdc46/Mcm family)